MAFAFLFVRETIPGRVLRCATTTLRFVRCPVDGCIAQFVLNRNLHRLSIWINGHARDGNHFALSLVRFFDRGLVDFLYRNAGDSRISLEGIFLAVEPCGVGIPVGSLMANPFTVAL